MAKMAPRSPSHSFAITALGGGRHDFPASGRCLHGEAKYTRAEVPLSTHLGEGAETPGIARQRSWGWMLPMAVPHSQGTQSLGRLGRLYTWCCTLGLAKLGATSCGKLPAADPTARWDLLFRINPHLAASAAGEAAFFPLAAMPVGPAGLVNFSEVWEACIFAAAVNSILFGEVLLVPFPPPCFLLCLPFLPFLSSYATSVSAQSNVCLAE